MKNMMLHHEKQRNLQHIIVVYDVYMKT